jgi:hypothetical protein
MCSNRLNYVFIIWSWSEKQCPNIKGKISYSNAQNHDWTYWVVEHFKFYVKDKY